MPGLKKKADAALDGLARTARRLKGAVRRLGVVGTGRRAVVRAAEAGIVRGALDRPWMEASRLLPGPANRHAVRAFAIRRSGHHAILNWIRYHAPGRHCVLNDCRVGENPFESARRSNSIVDGWAGEHRSFGWALERRGLHARKGTLIHNYEDADFRDYVREVPPEREREWLGGSERASTVIVLRDPYNLFASRLRWTRGLGEEPSAEHYRELVELWKAYARELAGRTEWLPGAVHVRYNDWFLSRAYRDEVAGRLGFENRDRGVDEVAKWGPNLAAGRSFDGLRYDGEAQRMRVLERWKRYVDDPFYRSLLEDEEMVGLAREVFGEIPGTGALAGPAA